MVHSGSASPMKTTPSASPHLTVSASSPPLPAAPLAAPPGNTADQDLTQNPARSLTTDLTSGSALSQPGTPTPADAEAPVATPAKELAASPWPDAPVNGRTSGRKRTPKACDCCGANSTGHNVRTLGRGKGRGRGRGRAASGGDRWDTPKRKVGGQLTDIGSFDWAKEKVEEAEDDSKVDTRSRTPAALPLPASPLDGSIVTYAGPERGDGQKNEDAVMERSTGTEGKRAPVVRGGGKGRRGRPKLGATSASKVEDGGVTKGGGLGGVVISSEIHALPQLVLVPRQGPREAAETAPDPGSVSSAFGNGATVDLCDTGPGEAMKEDAVVLCDVGDKPPSVSQQLGVVSCPASPQDLDPDMQVDQSPDQTAPATLPNGNVASPTNGDHCSALMEAEPYHSAPVLPQYQGPVSVSGVQHRRALRDHRRYCQPGTWEKEEMEDGSGRREAELDGNGRGEEESVEQLTDLIHEFLESFYMKYGSFIPLSETDVREHLKKEKGNLDLGNTGLDIKREMRRYRTGLASAPVAGFMVTYNKHTLGLEDLGTLEEQNWLNDQIINMYGELIMEATQHKVHFFNSFFHKQLVAKGYDGVKRWTKKVDLFSKWLLLIPIHLEIHWSLITVTMATKTISYYDSQGIVFRHTTDNIMKYLQSEARDKKQTAFQKGWKIAIIKGIPQQKNDSDCGAFVLEYCRCLSVKRPLRFSQGDMPRIRKRIYKELCDCRIND